MCARAFFVVSGGVEARMRSTEGEDPVVIVTRAIRWFGRLTATLT
jgi:hypothetical protein